MLARKFKVCKFGFRTLYIYKGIIFAILNRERRILCFGTSLPITRALHPFLSRVTFQRSYQNMSTLPRQSEKERRKLISQSERKDKNNRIVAKHDENVEF